MRHGGMGPRGHDGIEGHALGPRPVQEVPQLRRHIALRAPGGQKGKEGLEGPVGHLGGPAQGRELPGVLDVAEVLHDVLRGSQRDPRKARRQFLVKAVGDKTLFETQAGDSPLPHQTVERFGQGREGIPPGHYLKGGTFPRSLLRVARVGDEKAPGRGDHGKGIGAGESAQVAEVRSPGDKEGVQGGGP
ncbi:MAG: hypothetical protein BWY88_00145 [Synergistetes bacterium ADurb.Bin520]|nr:MAG: hypothetical protein BWY88_00145 [Synergistetes bacterium ADurb.Bin520]